MAKRLASTDIIVLDEADRLLQDGHFDEFEKILELFGRIDRKANPLNGNGRLWSSVPHSREICFEN